jgi:hypothetical protein
MSSICSEIPIQDSCSPRIAEVDNRTDDCGYDCKREICAESPVAYNLYDIFMFVHISVT